MGQVNCSRAQGECCEVMRGEGGTVERLPQVGLLGIQRPDGRSGEPKGGGGKGAVAGCGCRGWLGPRLWTASLNT